MTFILHRHTGTTIMEESCEKQRMSLLLAPVAVQVQQTVIEAQEKAISGLEARLKRVEAVTGF